MRHSLHVLIVVAAAVVWLETKKNQPSRKKFVIYTIICAHIVDPLRCECIGRINLYVSITIPADLAR